MKRIIMFKGDIETVEFFSLQIAEKLRELGHEIFFYDYTKEGTSAMSLFRFIKKGDTAAISFNFHGIAKERILQDERGVYLWEALDIPFFNILVDHPYFYGHYLSQVPSTYRNICIDEHQTEFMKRFYPGIKTIPTMFLAGTDLNSAIVDYNSQNIFQNPVPYSDQKLPFISPEEREPVISFVGNYNVPQELEHYLEASGPEYRDFYHGIIDDLLANPQKIIENVMEEHIRREIPGVTDSELLSTFGNLIFIDMYVRYTVRANITKYLADSGIPLHVYGEKWDILQSTCKHPENIIWHGLLNSVQCLEVLRKSRFSLNIMPWFRGGSHDRVFNSLLNGAICITDSNPAMDRILQNDNNALIYDLADHSDLPDRIRELSLDPEKIHDMSSNAYTAADSHTWHDRALFLHSLVEGEDPDLLPRI